MKTKQLYPVFLDLTGKHALIIGLGAVGRRKLSGLLRTPLLSITAVDPGLEHISLNLKTEEPHGPELILLNRPFEQNDLTNKTLVFAATSNSTLNERIARLCSEKGLWCNCAEQSYDGREEQHESSFFLPASFNSGDITIAVSTNGKSPALAKKIRKDLEALLGNRYNLLLVLMGKLRALILPLGLTQEENAKVFRGIVESPLAELLERGEKNEAARLLVRLLPPSMHPGIDDLLS